MATLVRRLKETAAGVSISLAIASGESPAQAAGPDGSAKAIHALRERPSARPPLAYTDGTYVARGWYGRRSSVTVTLTLTGDIITAAEIQPHAIDPASLENERRLAAAVRNVVVGKRVDHVRVGRIAGPGGTAEGFNDALRKIREVADVRSARARSGVA